MAKVLEGTRRLLAAFWRDEGGSRRARWCGWSLVLLAPLIALAARC